ncbi:hypothetical protein AB0F93_28380 [Micromonospora tulbaghiae]|uniref:hypothetical protein n=1 Tax=Micromonospora tulbaghiae TaxID=479978 RepID=UPI003322819B
MTTKQDTLLAVLDVEIGPISETDGPGTHQIIAARPANRPLRNDGVWRHWMAQGYVYDLRHDGTGWHVTSEQWTEREAAHLYRLAEPKDGALRGDLPDQDGNTIPLDTARTYQIRQEIPGGAWKLFTA